MGTYPLLSCSDWSSLRCDLDQVGVSLVSAIVVTDPFGDYDENLLRDCFRDLVTRF